MARLVRLTLRFVDVGLPGGGTCSRYQAGARARGELLRALEKQICCGSSEEGEARVQFSTPSGEGASTPQQGGHSSSWSGKVTGCRSRQRQALGRQKGDAKRPAALDGLPAGRYIRPRNPARQRTHTDQRTSRHSNQQAESARASHLRKPRPTG